MVATLKLRKSVAVVFLLLYVFIGIPLWYKLTTIYRATLPIEYIQSLHNDKFKEIHLTIPVFIKSDTYRFPDIHDAVQIQVNHLLRSKRHYVDWSLEIFPYDKTLIDTEYDFNRDNYHVVDLVLDEFVGYTLPHDSMVTTIYFTDESVASNDLPFFIAQILVEHTFQIEWNQWTLKPGQVEPNQYNNDHNSKQFAINYTPNIHLSISLLNGNGNPISWEIDKSLTKIFTPFRQLISPLYNFTVDTQIDHFNDLNLNQLNQIDNPTWHDLSHIIDLSELSSNNYFVEQNAINLVIVFPSKDNSLNGLQFLQDTNNKDGDNTTANSTSTSVEWGSFIVPRWGVLIVNKSSVEANSLITEEYLNPILLKFIKDLLNLLGIANNNNNNSEINNDDRDFEYTSPYLVIDSVKRIRIIENLNKSIDTLWSLVKLTEQFEQMTVPKEVLQDLTDALDTRLELIDLLNNPSKGSDMDWSKGLLMSNQIVKSCERAFFHGEMLQQNFFPQEHKLAVYLPLLGPLTVVIVSGLKAVFKEPHNNDQKLKKKKDD